VVVGNQTRQHNPEWAAARELGLPTTSEIEFFVSLAEDYPRLAVCGSHGKTTTSSLLAHMLEACDLDPGFRLGSMSLDFGSSARLGSGPFVFEGDEYTTAPWDSRPKFLLTRPAAACVTRLELDHPDVYPDLDAYRAPFVELARSMPRKGLLALCADDPECVALRQHARCRVVLYGESPDADWRVTGVRSDGDRQRFRVESEECEVPAVSLTFPGRHNALNATAALILGHHVGASLQGCVAACATFRGPSRRFEILTEVNGIAVVDDYAHHPTEVGATIAAARQRYPGRRIIAVHTPHTYSRTRTLLEDYRGSFDEADVVMLGPIDAARERHLPATVTIEEVAARVSGPECITVESSDAAIAGLVAMCGPGDVVLILSLVGFDKIALRLHAALRERHGEN